MKTKTNSQDDSHLEEKLKNHDVMMLIRSIFFILINIIRKCFLKNFLYKLKNYFYHILIMDNTTIKNFIKEIIKKQR